MSLIGYDAAITGGSSPSPCSDGVSLGVMLMFRGWQL